MKFNQSKEYIVNFWSLMNDQRWDEAKALLSDDFVAEFPQSGEKFNRDSFIEKYSNYPGIRSIEIDNLYHESDKWDRVDTVISEAQILTKTLDGKETSIFAISIFEIEDTGEERIRNVREYLNARR